MKLLSALVALVVADIDKENDVWPCNYEGVGRLFQTVDEVPEGIELPLEFGSRVPEWIEGSFFRNGPAIYEWGNTSFNHMFDPNGIIQAIRISDGEIRFQSAYIKGRNYRFNSEYEDIVMPEPGTYGEFNNITHNPDGSLIEDQSEIYQNRAPFIADYGATSNTLVSVLPFHGWLLSMGETPFFHLHDPYTLEIAHELDIRDATHLPDTMIITTITAHGLMDVERGSFWNSGSATDMSGAVPRLGNYVFESINAARPINDPFANPSTPEEVLASFRFSKVLPNPNPADLSIHYYHMFGMTQNYIILPMSSVLMKAGEIMSALMNAGDVFQAMHYMDDMPFEFKIFNKNTFKFEDRHFQTDAALSTHLINTFEENGQIVVDALMASNGNAMTMYTYETINATGSELTDNFLSVAPVGIFERYTLDMQGSIQGSQCETDKRHCKWVGPKRLLEVPEEQKACFDYGGLEFPIIDWNNRVGRNYNHFWANGFGTIMPDRVYHVDIESNNKWVYMIEGYGPSEPSFVKSPFSDEEDDGVIVVSMSPLSDSELRPFAAVLNARDMTEIARAYFPEGSKNPIGFHGIWVSHPARNFRLNRHV